MSLIVQLTDEPIDEGRAGHSVQCPEHGAELVFRGVVRNHHAGKAVEFIDYQAYRPMAEKELRGVATAVAARHSIQRLVVVHRLGVVRVGEASLFVAASAAHRGPLLMAVKELVDELKRRVPIWKKEFGPDGSHWVEGVIPDVHPPGVSGQ